jgi:GrpB-like predicted nucleotidyltransferase (UPF0157 family)
LSRTRTILIVDYDLAWRDLFQREADRVRDLLGGQIIELEHVGSTSVPGLAAKPIIDILLVVANSADENSYLASLESGAYLLRIREPNWYEHRLFKGTGEAGEPARAFVRLPGDRAHAEVP